MLKRPVALLVLLLVFVAGCGGGGGSGATEGSTQQEQALAVYLLLGQSNAVGYGTSTADLPQGLRAPQQALIFTGGQWVPLAPGAGYQTEGGEFGPEISFGAAMGAVGIIKVAKGATSLAVDWAPDSALYARAISEARAAAASRSVRFAGVLWVQGESDTFRSEWAGAYAQNLRVLVANLRRDLNSPELPFVAGRVNPTGPTYGAVNVATVRAAIMAPGIQNYNWLDLDELPKNADNVHYSTAGNVLMGERFAQALGQ